MPSFFTPDFGLLFWMLLAFLVVFVLLAKFGFPVIVKMVDERKAYIDGSLKSAREANEKLAHIKVESEKILKEAREQQAQILKEAMATRDQIVKDARIKAQIEAQKMLEDAKAQIQHEKDNALLEIKGQVADLSLTIAEKVLLKQLDDAPAQSKMINRMLDELVTK